MAFYSVRAEHKLALPLGEQLVTIAEARHNFATLLLGRLMQGATRFYLGEFVLSRAVLEQCSGLADPERCTSEGLAFDPYTVVLAYLGVTLAYLGYINQARSRMAEALLEARRLRHAHTLAQVLVFANWIDWLAGSLGPHIEEVLTLSTEHGFRYYLAGHWRPRTIVTFARTNAGRPWAAHTGVGGTACDRRGHKHADCNMGRRGLCPARAAR